MCILGMIYLNRAAKLCLQHASQPIGERQTKQNSPLISPCLFKTEISLAVPPASL